MQIIAGYEEADARIAYATTRHSRLLPINRWMGDQRMDHPLLILERHPG